MKRVSILITVLVLLLSFGSVKANAADFDYNNIISDEQASDYTSMTQVEIRDFLTEKGSRLKNYWYNGYNPSPGEEIIPKDQKAEVVVDRKEFLVQLKTASIFASRINEVKLKVLPKEQKIQVLCQNSELGEHISTFSAEISAART